MTEDLGSAAPGWYPVTHEPPQVGYWDGAAWTGVQRRAGMGGNQPRDETGMLALILLIAGFVGTILVPLAFSGLHLPAGGFTFAMIVDLALTPLAFLLSIAGLVGGFAQRFKTPVSLATLIVSALGTIFLVLPIGLFVTGAWVLPHF